MDAAPRRKHSPTGRFAALSTLLTCAIVLSVSCERSGATHRAPEPRPPRPRETTPAATPETPARPAVGTPGAIPPAPAPTARPDNPRWVESGGLRFLVREENAGPTERLPLIVALHGLGDSPTGFLPIVEGFPGAYRMAAAQAPQPYGHDGYAWLPVPRPRDPNDRAVPIERAAAQVAPAIADLTRALPTCGMPALLGFSQGAMVTFGVAARRQPVIQLAVPIAGYLPTALIGDAPASAPDIVALHGARDRVVGVSAGRRSVRDLVRAGYHAELREYEGTGHTISLFMRDDLRALMARYIAGAHCRDEPGQP